MFSYDHTIYSTSITCVSQFIALISCNMAFQGITVHTFGHPCKHVCLLYFCKQMDYDMLLQALCVVFVLFFFACIFSNPFLFCNLLYPTKKLLLLICQAFREYIVFNAASKYTKNRTTPITGCCGTSFGHAGFSKTTARFKQQQYI